jgi:serine protease Do
MKKDLAILKPRSSLTSVKPLALSQVEGSMGQDVFTMGFPMSDVLGNSPRLNKGLINATVGLKDNTDQLQVSAEIQPGNSGSPLFNSQKEVIGIIVGTLNSLAVMRATQGALPQNVNFALKIGPIGKFLQESGISESTEKVAPSSFDEAKGCIARIYSGIVPLEKPPELVCTIYYQSFWDVWYRFRFLRLRLYDRDTGKLILEAGQYRDNPFSNEDQVLDRTIAEIKKFFEPNK